MENEMELSQKYDLSEIRDIDVCVANLKKLSQVFARLAESNTYEKKINESLSILSNGVNDVIHDATIDMFLTELFNQYDKDKEQDYEQSTENLYPK